MVGEVGLEPTKAKPADLQSAPFAARDTPPKPPHHIDRERQSAVLAGWSGCVGFMGMDLRGVNGELFCGLQSLRTHGNNIDGPKAMATQLATTARPPQSSAAADPVPHRSRFSCCGPAVRLAYRQGRAGKPRPPHPPSVGHGKCIAPACR